MLVVCGRVRLPSACLALGVVMQLGLASLTGFATTLLLATSCCQSSPPAASHPHGGQRELLHCPSPALHGFSLAAVEQLLAMLLPNCPSIAGRLHRHHTSLCCGELAVAESAADVYTVFVSCHMLTWAIGICTLHSMEAGISEATGSYTTAAAEAHNAWSIVSQQSQAC